MDHKPLMYIRAGSSKASIADAVRFWGDSKSPVGNRLLVWALAMLNYVLGILYTTVYFYLMPFLPMLVVIVQSYSQRHSPVIDISEI